MPTEDIEARFEAANLRALFTPHGPGKRLGADFSEAYLAASPSERDRVRTMAADAAVVANHALHDNHATRGGDMTAWFALEGRSMEDIAEEGAAMRRRWEAQTRDEPEDEEAERRRWAAEEEEERLQDLDDSGWYGRTHPYLPECEDWIFVRFGRMPAAGASTFGLAGEDNEDGPDEWRIACGNKTHESGICVLRAYRHPSVPDAYVLSPPDFQNALYGVSGGFSDYLNNVCPRFEEGEAPVVLRVDGSPVTSLGRDRTLRIELGSDGEYMVDSGKPMTVHALGLGDVWVSEGEAMDEFLRKRRGYEWVEPSPGPGP